MTRFTLLLRVTVSRPLSALPGLLGAPSLPLSVPLEPRPATPSVLDLFVLPSWLLASWLIAVAVPQPVPQTVPGALPLVFLLFCVEACLPFGCEALLFESEFAFFLSPHNFRIERLHGGLFSQVIILRRNIRLIDVGSQFFLRDIERCCSIGDATCISIFRNQTNASTRRKGIDANFVLTATRSFR